MRNVSKRRLKKKNQRQMLRQRQNSKNMSVDSQDLTNFKESLNQAVSTNTALRNTVIDLAVESWRLRRTLNRVVNKLDPLEQKRFNRSVSWFYKKLDESIDSVGLKIVNVEGKEFSPGMAITPLNIDDLPADENLSLIIESMLEPIIMGPQGMIVRTGSAMLAIASGDLKKE